MAGETLLTSAETLAGFPDNTQGLITPLDVRNFVVSSQTSLGFMEDAGPFTIPLVDGVWTSILANVPTPAFVGLFWKLDGSNRFLPAYTDAGIIVNVGSTRFTTMQTFSESAKDAGGAAVLYSSRILLGGTVIGPVNQVSRDDTPTVAIGARDFLQDIDLLEPIDIQIRPDGHSNGITINDFTIQLEGLQI